MVNRRPKVRTVRTLGATGPKTVAKGANRRMRRDSFYPFETKRRRRAMKKFFFVFAVDAPAVRPGRLRVRVVVEVETLLVRWFHPGHLRGHLFNSIRARSHS